MTWPAHCIACGNRIDLDELQARRKAGLKVRHACGRILVQAQKH